MKRRLLIAGAALGGALAGVAGLRSMVPGLRNPLPGDLSLGNTFSALSPFASSDFEAHVRRPGMALGHLLREKSMAPLVWPGDAAKGPARRVDVAVIGSGVAGLSCAWQLNREGATNFVLLQGPAPLGNSSFGQHAISSYPHGAHYLPLPSLRNMHVREMLHEFGILQQGLNDERPHYDERAVVHAGMDRVLHEGSWQAGLLPDLSTTAQAELQVAQAEFDRFGRLLDEQQLAVFGTPLHAANLQGESARATLDLDQISFGQWLTQMGVRDETLRWYFDYCCRDEYGVPAQAVSAWAGVHYFSSEHGQAANADHGAVLTWPQGLGYLAGQLQASLAAAQQLPAAAVRVRRIPSGGYEVLCLDERNTTSVVRCDKVVVATPLFMARRLLPEVFEDLREAPGPPMSPWLVANFFMERLVPERNGVPLCWDNVVSGSRNLGYVVATHQGIAQARPAGTVFTAYCPLTEEAASRMAGTRQWAATATVTELLEVATRDLDAAYGASWRPWCKGTELTVHGHAMAVPAVGFLREPLARRARQVTAERGHLAFAHSDLSGYSVFEEASYWGTLAAKGLLAS